MVKYYAQVKRIFDESKITVVGSPTITSDGIASGFSGTNYITTSKPISSNNNIFKFKFKYNGVKPESGNFYYLVLTSGEGELFYVYQNPNNALSIYSSKTGATSIFTGPMITLSANHIGTTFNIEVVTTSEKYTCNVYRDSVLLGSQSIATTNLLPSNITKVNLGGQQNSSTINSNLIDLPSFSITVDNELVYSPTKPVYSLERRKEGFDSSKFTVVGSPTITADGVASGFSANNYLTVPNKILQMIGQNPFEIRVKFSNIPMFAGTISFPSVLGNMSSAVENRTNITLSRNNQNPFLFLEANFTDGTHTTIGYTTNIPATLTDVEYSLIFDGSTYTVKALANGVQLPFTRGTVSLEGKFIDWGTEDLFIGVRSVGASFDLKQFSITVDGIEVFTGAKEKFYAMRGM